MKINSNFKLRLIAGETIIVNQGTPDADLTRIISLNTSARLLWERLSGKEFTRADVVSTLVDTYHVSTAQAEKDAATWINGLNDSHLLIADD